MNRIDARRVAVSVAVTVLLLAATRGRAEDSSAFAKWEKEIGRFEKQDKDRLPPKDATLFAGSSSIRLWNLAKSFPGKAVINRGFGGSQIADSTHFAPRIILPNKPRLIVFYAGDNDIAAGKTPERVAEDFRKFAKLIHASLPKTKIVFIGIKPSLARLAMREKQKKANDLIEAYCKKDDRLVYLDVEKPMLGDDGKPRKDLLAKDGLHMSEKGYKIWASMLEPYLK
jgi:lysophospholipase L1-like esterase